MKKKSIAVQLLMAVLFFNLCCILIITGLQAYWKYRSLLVDFDEEFLRVDNHIPGMTNSLWLMDKDGLQLELDALLNMPYFVYLEIDIKGKVFASSGVLETTKFIKRTYPLTYLYDNSSLYLGTLEIYADQQIIYNKLLAETYALLANQAIFVFFISFFILFIVRTLITRHLSSMARLVATLDPHKMEKPLFLKTRKKSAGVQDEIDLVLTAINKLVFGLQNAFNELNAELEKRRQTEEQLKTKEKTLNKAQEIAHIGSWYLDIEKNILSWSDETYRIFGLTPQRFGATYQAFLDTIHPDDREEVDRTYKNAIAQKLPYESVHRIVRPNGEVRTVLEKSEDVVDASGKTIHSFGMVHDITEIREAENKILRAKEEWEKTFDAINDIITIKDKDMRIVRANKAFHEAFQVEPGALNGKYCYEVFRGIKRPCQDCPEIETLKDRQTHNANIAHKNLGKIFHVASSPIMDENGELTHIVHIARDITEQKKMEEELFQAHKMEAIGTLAGGIAHDFNNILAVILGYAEMVRDALPDESHTKSDINQVLKAANHAKKLVKQILAFSRKGQKTQQPLQPTPVIKEALKLMRASLPTTIEIQEKIDPDCGSIIANPTNVHQILVNLCTNALHAMEEEKGILTVKLTRVELKEPDLIHESGVSEGSFVELMVSDTGCGMDKRTIERIFEPYFTTKGVGKGTGMGLALVHGIVQGCGGFIKVESELNKGTTFHIYFPAIEEKTVGSEEEQQEPLPRGDERILAVDDEEVIVRMYRATLERLGYKVTTYSSSEKALEVFQSSPNNFDLIITDQTMPHLPGSELAKELLQIRPDIPIILCTGYSSMISEEKAEEIGIKRFVMKPLSLRDLAMIVREVLDKSKS